MDVSCESDNLNRDVVGSLGPHLYSLGEDLGYLNSCTEYRVNNDGAWLNGECRCSVHGQTRRPEFLFANKATIGEHTIDVITLENRIIVSATKL